MCVYGLSRKKKVYNDSPKNIKETDTIHAQISAAYQAVLHNQDNHSRLLFREEFATTS